MDFFAHGFWAALYGVIVNRRLKRKLNLWHVAFWGVFPDLLAFSPHIMWNYILGNGSHLPVYVDGTSMAQITNSLYSLGHSLVTFLLVAGIAYLVSKRVPWVLGGWLLHILFDIPTHTHQFYPTPFLWPLSHFTFNGIFWGTPWFMVVNYGMIVGTYVIVKIYEKRA